MEDYIGEKFDLYLTPVECTAFNNNYTYKFVDDEERVFIWNRFNPIDKFLSGKKFHIRGTVRKIIKNNGEYQTVITRCKIV